MESISESRICKLKESYEHYIEYEKAIKTNKYNNGIKHDLMMLASTYYSLGIISHYLHKDISKAKDYFNLQGKCEILLSKEHNELGNIRLFQVARTLILNVAISDNQELINEYSKHNYIIKYVSRDKEVVTDYKKWVSKGDDCIYSELMLNSISKDFTSLEKNLKIFFDFTLKKKTNARMILDFQFYESLLTRNVSKITNAIENFLTKKEHKYRNFHDKFPELISYPAVGYVKICLINGINVEIDNELIPNDLLRIASLSTYSEIDLRNYK